MRKDSTNLSDEFFQFSTSNFEAVENGLISFNGNIVKEFFYKPLNKYYHMVYDNSGRELFVILRIELLNSKAVFPPKNKITDGPFKPDTCVIKGILPDALCRLQLVKWLFKKGGLNSMAVKSEILYNILQKELKNLLAECDNLQNKIHYDPSKNFIEVHNEFNRPLA